MTLGEGTEQVNEEDNHFIYIIHFWYNVIGLHWCLAFGKKNYKIIL